MRARLTAGFCVQCCPGGPACGGGNEGRLRLVLDFGKPALVREKEPFDDPDETHGVCAEHKERLKTGERMVSVDCPATETPVPEAAVHRL